MTTLIFIPLFLCLAWAQEPQPDEKKKSQEKDLTELSLEELMNLEVTSVSKKEQKLQGAASAIFVIRNEDLRRAGVTSIAEALRMVPGVQVAHLDANKWAISSRGFNGRFANKLLVLVDGRSVYTPLFSGVYWDAQDTLLEDVERIEVIRGPGGTLWGANAVNGVINIITKNSKETQGAVVQGGLGTEERDFAGARWGGAVCENFSYRAFAKYFNRDEQRDGHDDWWMARGGFRADWKVGPETNVTFQGDYYDGFARDLLTEPTTTAPFSVTHGARTDLGGGNLLARWEQTMGEKSNLQLQFYYDRTHRRTEIHHEDRDTFDLDFQHRFPLFGNQDLVWGLGYRVTSDEIDGTFTLSFTPDERTDDLFSAFLQDEIALIPETLYVTVGSKFEYNDYTHFEFQPSARISWMPHARHAVWASVNRAVRTPSRSEDDVLIHRNHTTPGVILATSGNRDFDSEELLAFELGYRVQPLDEVTLDLTAFYNVYDDLRTLEPGTPTPLPPPIFLPLVAANRMEGETYGIEVSCNLRLVEGWMVQASYSLLRMHLTRDANSGDTTAENAEGESPRNQAYLRSAMNLPLDLELDVMFRYVDNLPKLNVDRYAEMDVRLGWRQGDRIEVALVGQNLLDRSHLEFSQAFIDTQPTEVERSVYLMATVRF